MHLYKAFTAWQLFGDATFTLFDISVWADYDTITPGHGHQRFWVTLLALFWSFCSYFCLWLFLVVFFKSPILQAWLQRCQYVFECDLVNVLFSQEKWNDEYGWLWNITSIGFNFWKMFIAALLFILFCTCTCFWLFQLHYILGNLLIFFIEQESM